MRLASAEVIEDVLQLQAFASRLHGLLGCPSLHRGPVLLHNVAVVGELGALFAGIKQDVRPVLNTTQE
jgi:hypothetical protein